MTNKMYIIHNKTYRHKQIAKQFCWIGLLCAGMNISICQAENTDNSLPTLHTMQEQTTNQQDINTNQITQQDNLPQVSTQQPDDEDTAQDIDNETQDENNKQEDQQRQKQEQIKTQSNIQEKQKQQQEKTKILQTEVNQQLNNKNKAKNAIKDEEMGKLITNFNLQKALDYNYNTIKYINTELLENASEFRVIKQALNEQINPELKKQKMEEEAKRKSLAEAIKKGEVMKPFNGIHLTSLLFFNENEWACIIDGKTIKSTDKRKKTGLYSIVKVNKTSMVFLLNKTTKTMIKQVEALVENMYPYYQNYFITNDKGKQHIGFKLFVGQTIDFDTMRITG